MVVVVNVVVDVVEVVVFFEVVEVLVVITEGFQKVIRNHCQTKAFFNQ